MAHITVYIQPQSVSYDPDKDIKHGDTVTFSLDGRSDDVTVTFPSSTPFSTSSIALTSQLTQQMLSVAANAPRGSYHFYFPQHHEDRDPPDTVPGDLDVTTDPPEW